MKPTQNLHLNLNLNDSPVTDDRDYPEQSPLSSPRFHYTGKGILINAKHPEPGTKYKAFKQEVHDIIASSRPFNYKTSFLTNPKPSSRENTGRGSQHPFSKMTGSQSHRVLSGSIKNFGNTHAPVLGHKVSGALSSRGVTKPQEPKRPTETHLPTVGENLAGSLPVPSQSDQLDQKAKMLMKGAAGGSVVYPPGSNGYKDNYQPNSWQKPSQWTENHLGYSPSNPFLERIRNPDLFYQPPSTARAKPILHKHQKLFAIQQLLYTTR